ncbi:MAG: rRNA maturation RNase YbeY, partial [Clostridia bacterium]|nr:rRNA maturation RNase YbeY [Clostridia bacterium]
MPKIKVECLQKKVNIKKITNAVLKVLSQKEKFKVEIVFESLDEIHALNKQMRGVDKPTDVLSFPTLDGIREKIINRDDCLTELDGKYIMLGSIVLCEDKIKEQAKEYGHSEERERNYLIIHGLLHLFGY